MVSKSELKFIRSLKNKKYRILEKCFLVEGRKNVQEALKSHFKIRLVLTTTDGNIEPFILKNNRVEAVSQKVLESVSALHTNDSVLAVVEIPDSRALNTTGIIFCLDGVRDPGNLGTIIRTLDWFGFDQLLCSHDCADFYNSKVIQASMGSFTRVNVMYDNLTEFIKKYDGKIMGADMNGTSIYEISSLPQKGLIIMGNESNGISPEVASLLDEKITIPKKGDAESLNVGIATGIISSVIARLS